MNKYFGMIGFGVTCEKAPGVWEESVEERPYYGDVVRYSRRSQSGDKVIDDLNLTNEISIVMDAFIKENAGSILYLTWMGSKWKVVNVSVNHPRLTLSFGGVYNGDEGPRSGCET